MSSLRDPIGTEQIELMFAEDLNFFVYKELDQRSFFQKLKIKHFFALPSIILKRIYKILPPICKDIFFWAWVPHRAPASKFFARTRYAELRTLIDIKLSFLTLRSIPVKLFDSVKNTFDAGFYSTNLADVSELDLFVSDVIHYASPTHAGARPYYKDGKDQKIEGSFSAYYNFSVEDNKRISTFILKRIDKDFNSHLSALAGYKCNFKDISYSLGIVYGENSNSEMHQDTFASIAKGFIYLQDVSTDNSPFEYIEGSYKDAAFRSSQTNRAVIESAVREGDPGLWTIDNWIWYDQEVSALDQEAKNILGTALDIDFVMVNLPYLIMNTSWMNLSITRIGKKGSFFMSFPSCCSITSHSISRKKIYISIST